MLRNYLTICLLLSLNICFAQPQIRVEPASINDSLVTDQIEEYELTIFNDGDDTLEYEITHGYEWESLQGVLGSFQGINEADHYCSCVGWDPDNEWMWISNYSTGTVAAYSHNGNYEQFEETVRLQDSIRCMDGTFANGLLYIGAWADSVVGLWDTEGERIRNIVFPYPVYGLATDHEAGLLFVMNGDNQDIHVYQFDDEGDAGDELGAIDDHYPFHGNIPAYGFEWVEAHPDGQLWMTNSTSGDAYQIAVDTDEWTAVETVQSFSIGGIGQPYCTIAHDGDNLWAGGYTADNIRIYPDGIRERDWLFYEPDSGGVEANDDDVIAVTIDANNLRGEREASINIHSNDPELENFVVQVSITVEDQEQGVFPDEVALSANDFSLLTAFPNPFNSQTSISYHLPTKSHIDLALYDISGREVMTLYNGVRQAGEWSATVEATDLASGLYLVRMSVGDQLFSRKLICVK